MKKLLLIFTFCFCCLLALAQSNPYKIFNYKAKVIYPVNKQDTYRIKNANDTDRVKYLEFDFENHKINLLGKNDIMIGRVEIPKDELLRWVSADPLAEKYPGSSPYNYVDNNPVHRIDVDGRDWIVATRTVNGKTQINLTFAGAVMNSSGKNINMNAFIAGQVKEFEHVFGQGNVHANLMLRQVSSANDFKIS